MRAHQRIGIIQLGARQQVQARRVHQHHGPVALHHQVVLGARAVQFEAILEPAAAAGQHRHAQCLRRAGRLALHDRLDLRCRAGTQPEGGVNHVRDHSL